MEKPPSPPAPEPAPKRKKLALGRGLGALIPDAEPGLGAASDYFFCEIGLIRPNRFQPRQRFTEEELEELSGSIREQGVLQPLIVRKSGAGFELVAGERRLRAARRVGLERVPVVLRDVSDDQMLEMSLVENIQRADLNPIEEAEAYHGLIQRLGLTQDQAAARVGKSRSAVANFLRLRQLPEPIKANLADGTLSMGHARALLAAETSAQQLAAWRAVLDRGLSVRETEALVRRLKAQPKKPRVSPKSSEALQLASLSDELSRHMGTKVSIRRTGRQGRIEIEFYSHDDLDRLLAHLRQPRRG
jgi:ParB family chromosome partitioning protein